MGSLCACFVVCTLRLEMRWDKYLSWVIALVVGYGCGVLAPESVKVPFLSIGMAWSALDTGIRFFMNTPSGTFGDVPGLTFKGIASFITSPVAQTTPAKS